MSIKSVNPGTGQLLREYQEMEEKELSAILDGAQAAFQDWRRVAMGERAKLMHNVSQVLKKHREEYARLMSLEMGKPITSAGAEVDKCAWVCEYYAEKADTFLKPEMIKTEAGKSFVTYQPLGVILAVMPWNFPFWQLFRFAAPALMAGNAAVLKHASNVPGSALALEDIFRQAGFPEDLFRTLLISAKQVAQVIEHAHIKGVTLTGSTPAGRAVAAKAGAMLKKTVLELGGSDPYLILEDAPLEAAAATCVASRLINSGQSCIAAKRFIVVESLVERFTELCVKEMQGYKMGDPLDESVQIGPQARIDLRDQLHRQVQTSLEMGAECVLGGTIPPGRGAFYPPTVLTKVRKGMPAYEEELFGPVAAIISAKDEKEAIRIANDTPFGLGAAVFTADPEKGERIAVEELEAGCCFVNSLVKSDPRLPFGGIKQSGYGRELSYSGIREFVNIKTISMG